MSKGIPIAEAAKRDPLIAEALEKIKSGEISFNCGPLNVVWTPEDIARLDAALAKVFGWK